MRKRVCLGAFAGAHGVRGEARMKTFTATEKGIAAYGPVESEDGARRFALQFIRALKEGVALVRAPEIRSREDAAALSGVRVYVDRALLPPPADDEFYVEDLVGLAAFDEKGERLGAVSAVHNFGAGDILEIARPQGETMMAPFTHEAILSIDVAGGRLTVAADAFAEDPA